MANVNKLSATRLTRVVETLRQVLLKTGPYNQAEIRAIAQILLPRREASARCPKCAGDCAATVGGRTTYFCRTHQKR